MEIKNNDNLMYRNVVCNVPRSCNFLANGTDIQLGTWRYSDLIEMVPSGDQMLKGTIMTFLVALKSCKALK